MGWGGVERDDHDAKQVMDWRTRPTGVLDETKAMTIMLSIQNTLPSALA